MLIHRFLLLIEFLKLSSFWLNISQCDIYWLYYIALRYICQEVLKNFFKKRWVGYFLLPPMQLLRSDYRVASQFFI